MINIKCVCPPFGEARFCSTLQLISLLLLRFLFTALGSSFSRPLPLALSFFSAASLAADRLWVVSAGATGGLLSKNRMSSPSEKPRPSVGVDRVAGLWLDLGTSEAALGDSRVVVCFWRSSALRLRFSKSSFCLSFCCFRRSEAEMDWTDPASVVFLVTEEKHGITAHRPLQGKYFHFYTAHSDSSSLKSSLSLSIQ